VVCCTFSSSLLIGEALGCAKHHSLLTTVAFSFDLLDDDLILETLAGFGRGKF